MTAPTAASAMAPVSATAPTAASAMAPVSATARAADSATAQVPDSDPDSATDSDSDSATAQVMAWVRGPAMGRVAVDGYYGWVMRTNCGKGSANDDYRATGPNH